MPPGSSEFYAVVLGLASAVCWGASDFSGGLAARRSSASSVVIASQAIGSAFLLALLLPFPETFPPWESMLWGAAGGMAGGVGLVAFYRALADRQMGMVAPVGGVVGALIPVIAATFIDGWPTVVKLAGFVAALAAVWLVSSGNRGGPIRPRDLGLPAFAGIGFGLFFIFIDRASDTALLWPLVAARIASVGTLLAVAVIQGQAPLPDVKHLPMMALVGVFDTTANALYALTARLGRLDIAAVLGSLYSGVTVLLAWLILRERLARLQWVGVFLALVAILLIAA